MIVYLQSDTERAVLTQTQKNKKKNLTREYKQLHYRWTRFYIAAKWEVMTYQK